MHWYIKALKRFTDFKGRSRRKEYWMFALFNVIISITTTLLDYAFGTASFVYYIGLFSMLYGLFVFIPFIAVSVRRLHDTGKTGWMLLIAIIPIIGAIWLLVLFATEGTRGTNMYGSDPKAKKQFMSIMLNM